jgi:hypothetical protein
MTLAGFFQTVTGYSEPNSSQIYIVADAERVAPVVRRKS